MGEAVVAADAEVTASDRELTHTAEDTEGLPLVTAVIMRLTVVAPGTAVVTDGETAVMVGGIPVTVMAGGTHITVMDWDWDSDLASAMAWCGIWVWWLWIWRLRIWIPGLWHVQRHDVLQRKRSFHARCDNRKHGHA